MNSDSPVLSSSTSRTPTRKRNKYDDVSSPVGEYIRGRSPTVKNSPHSRHRRDKVLRGESPIPSPLSQQAQRTTPSSAVRQAQAKGTSPLVKSGTRVESAKKIVSNHPQERVKQMDSSEGEQSPTSASLNDYFQRKTPLYQLYPQNKSGKSLMSNEDDDLSDSEGQGECDGDSDSSNENISAPLVGGYPSRRSSMNKTNSIGRIDETTEVADQENMGSGAINQNRKKNEAPSGETSKEQGNAPHKEASSLKHENGKKSERIDAKDEPAKSGRAKEIAATPVQKKKQSASHHSSEKRFRSESMELEGQDGAKLGSDGRHNSTAPPLKRTNFIGPAEHRDTEDDYDALTRFVSSGDNSSATEKKNQDFGVDNNNDDYEEEDSGPEIVGSMCYELMVAAYSFKPGTVRIQDWLEVRRVKRGNSSSNWKNRWVVVQSNVLFVFRSRSARKPLLTVFLEDSDCTVSQDRLSTSWPGKETRPEWRDPVSPKNYGTLMQHPPERFYFTLRTRVGRNLFFCTLDVKVRDAWVKILSSPICDDSQRTAIGTNALQPELSSTNPVSTDARSSYGTLASATARDPLLAQSTSTTQEDEGEERCAFLFCSIL